VRTNRDGVLYVPDGYVAAVAVDPIEKKPFYHVLPGSAALSFGMLGCDYHCGYCQNWITSQALRDPDAVAPLQPITPEQLSSSLCAAARRSSPPPTTSAHHERMGGPRAPPRQGARPPRGLRLERERYPRVLDFLRPWVISTRWT